MPVIYYNIDEQKSLEKEPYKSLTKRFKNLKNALEEKEIELSIATDKEGFRLRGVVMLLMKCVQREE